MDRNTTGLGTEPEPLLAPRKENSSSSRRWDQDLSGRLDSISLRTAWFLAALMSGIGSWTEQRQFHPIQCWTTFRPDRHAAGGRPSQGWPIKLIFLPISPLGPSDRRLALLAPPPHLCGDLLFEASISWISVPAWRTVPVVVVVVVAVVVLTIMLADVLAELVGSFALGASHSPGRLRRDVKPQQRPSEGPAARADARASIATQRQGAALVHTHKPTHSWHCVR